MSLACAFISGTCRFSSPAVFPSSLGGGCCSSWLLGLISSASSVSLGLGWPRSFPSVSSGVEDHSSLRVWRRLPSRQHRRRLAAFCGCYCGCSLPGDYVQRRIVFPTQTLNLRFICASTPALSPAAYCFNSRD